VKWAGRVVGEYCVTCHVGALGVLYPLRRTLDSNAVRKHDMIRRRGEVVQNSIRDA